MEKYQRIDALSRTQLLFGESKMKRINNVKVIIFGIGGVGSWCAESLIRSGVRHLTIVDGDKVCVSNINRQRMATIHSIGMAKVDEMKKILLSLSPDAEIMAINEVYCAETANQFRLEEYDYIIDAIDSLDDKALLIENATNTNAKLFSSMGAALKIDPTKVKVAEFWKVTDCPLARALRQKFKRNGIKPKRKFLCVYSEERLKNCSIEQSESKDNHKANGSLMHITAIFGLTIAGLILKNLYEDI